jgi:hypothetical protein
VVGRVRERGFEWCVRSLVAKLPKGPRGIVERIGLILPALRFLVAPGTESERRILGLVDLRVTPSTYGEVLTFQEVLLTERIRRGVDKIDIVWVHDPEEPARRDQGLTSDNYRYYLADRLPLAHINPYLGSFFLMDSPRALEQYVRDNADRYEVFPAFRDYVGKRWSYRDYHGMIQKFHREYGYVPQLSCQPSMLMWARSFLADQVRPQLPVAVHLRSDKMFGTHRDVAMDSWIEFFDSCRQKFDVKFVVICGRDEIAPQLRALSNVLVAKDHGTTFEQDAAIIQVSSMFMGGPSGIAQMAVFSSIPYIIVNYVPGAISLERGGGHPFATPLQRLIWERETTDLLIKEFTELFPKIDTTKWEQEFDPLAEEAKLKLQRWS